LKSADRLKQTTKNHNHTKSDDPQIPQPDLRFASGNQAKAKQHQDTPKTGPEPKQKHPTNRSAVGRSGIHCVTTKNMQTKKTN